MSREIDFIFEYGAFRSVLKGNFENVPGIESPLEALEPI
jgi:hypothetical protein